MLAVFAVALFLMACGHSGSPGSPTPKGKSLGHEWRFSVECSDDAHTPLGTGVIKKSSSGLTLGRSQ